MILIEYYHNAEDFILNSEYKSEIDWVKNIIPLNKTDAETFYLEYVYVVLNAGMKEQVARKIFIRFTEHLEPSVIGHTGKRKAVETGLVNYKRWFEELKRSNNKVEYLQTLPWIGPITKYHLARNIGIETVKPDRHLGRLAEYFGYPTPLKMCEHIKKVTGVKLGIIDIVLWRYCNIYGSKTIEEG